MKNNNLAVIVGGSKGLGKYTSIQLAKKGYQTVIAARDKQETANVTNQINKSGWDSYPFQVDVRKRDSVKKLFNYIDQNFGHIEILVNCAGVGIFGPVEGLSETDLDIVLDTNLKGIIFCCQEAVKIMKKQGNGHIVNVSSSADHIGRANETIYSASKFGVAGFTESLAAEVLKFGIIVTLFSPGGIKTSFWDNCNINVDTSSFMDPKRVAKVLVDTISNSQGLAIQVVRVGRLK